MIAPHEQLTRRAIIARTAEEDRCRRAALGDAPASESGWLFGGAFLVVLAIIIGVGMAA